MFGSSKGEYDRGVNTFSPDGRLFQIEFAMEAIKLDSTAIGIQYGTSHFVVVCVDITYVVLADVPVFGIFVAVLVVVVVLVIIFWCCVYLYCCFISDLRMVL